MSVENKVFVNCSDHNLQDAHFIIFPTCDAKTVTWPNSYVGVMCSCICVYVQHRLRSMSDCLKYERKIRLFNQLKCERISNFTLITSFLIISKFSPISHAVKQAFPCLAHYRSTTDVSKINHRLGDSSNGEYSRKTLRQIQKELRTRVLDPNAMGHKDVAQGISAWLYQWPSNNKRFDRRKSAFPSILSEWNFAK